MYSVRDYEEQVSLLASLMLPLPNRGRRSCACECDSGEEGRATEAWPWGELGLGDVRRATWRGCVFGGSRQTAEAFGSSLRKKTQKEGCPARGGCFWGAPGAPG